MDNQTKKRLIKLGREYLKTCLSESDRKLKNARNASEKRYRQKDRETVLAYYGHKCACCGETKKEFLQVDHMENDGAEHRRSIGRRLYRWLIKNDFPGGFQILCANCNCSKGFYGYCPHWLEKSGAQL